MAYTPYQNPQHLFQQQQAGSFLLSVYVRSILYGSDKDFGLASVEQWANGYSVDGYTSGWRVPTIDELRYIPLSGNYNTVNSAYTLVSNKGNGLRNSGFSSTPTGTEGYVYIISYTREDLNYTGDANVRNQQNGDIVHSLP